MIKLPEPAGYFLKNTETHAMLSTVLGLLMGYKESACVRPPYKSGSIIDKIVGEAVEHLKDWPYSEVAPPTPYYTEDQLKQAIRDALTQAACLFQQDHVEYFGDEVRREILKLKEELK